MLINAIAGGAIGLLSSLLVFGLAAGGVLRTPLGSQLLFLALAFHITGLIWALGRHRARGQDSFARLFGAGLMVSLVAGLVISVGSLVFTTAVDPTYVEWVQGRSLEQLSQMELSDEERGAHEAQIRGLTPGGYAMQGLMGTLATGLFLSLTFAALLRLRVLRVAKRG